MEIEQHDIDGPHGTIPVRVYRPASVGSTGLVWLHGGGFIGGDLDMPESDWVARRLATSGVMVVAVQYRLAPPPDAWAGYVQDAGGTSRYPVASEEAAAAFTWATTVEERLPAFCWALGGASAGANIAAGATFRLLDGQGAAPAAVVLAYPLVHAALPEMAPELRAKFESPPPTGAFSPETVAELNLNYTGDPRLLADRYAFPGGQDLTGFPPTIIVNSDFDSLRASGDLFGRELVTAGVDVTVVREPGTKHGHLNEPDTVGAQRSLRRIARWLPSVFVPSAERTA